MVDLGWGGHVREGRLHGHLGKPLGKALSQETGKDLGAHSPLLVNKVEMRELPFPLLTITLLLPK